MPCAEGICYFIQGLHYKFYYALQNTITKITLHDTRKTFMDLKDIVQYITGIISSEVR